MLSTILIAAVCGAATPTADTIMSSAVVPQDAVLQDKAELRKEFEEKLKQADPKSADELFAVALWAERNGLTAESQRALRKVLVVATDHEEARKKLGYVKHEDKWFLENELASHLKKEEAENKRKEEAEYKKKGYVKHEGAWVKQSDLAYAKLGLTQSDGQWMRVSDKKLLDSGKVQHPQTGEWIKKEDLEKATQGLFPFGNDWVTLERANLMHGDGQAPWNISTDNVTLVTTYEFAKAREMANDAESAATIARNILFDPLLPLPRRVVLFAFPTAEQYREFGARLDDTGFSSYGAFFAYRHEAGAVACFYGEKDWGPYYLRHAAGLGVAAQLLASPKMKPTHWLLTGVGSYVERWANPGHAKWFAPQFLQKGGIRGVKSFCSSFQISGDQSPDEMQREIYQAGILVSYVATDPDKKTAKAWEEIRDAIRDGKGVEKAITSFERAIQTQEQALRDHLQKLTKS